MQGIEKLIDALYSQFLLRDFFGKIIPGAFFLSSLLLMFNRAKGLHDLGKDFSTAEWIIFFGLSWITALGLQSLGERSWVPTTTQSGCLETWYNQIIQFRDSKYDHLRQDFERFVVIKEACANMHVSLVVSIPPLLIYAAPYISFNQSNWHWPEPLLNWISYIICIVLYLIFICLFYFMYRIHLTRQIEFLRAALASSNNTAASPVEADASPNETET